MKPRLGRIAAFASVLAVVSAASIGLSSPAFAVPSTTPTLTAPTDGATVAGAVAVTATSTEAFVQFFVDGVELGTPVSVVSGDAATAWPTFGLANDAVHTIAAADCDNDACAAPGASISVTVHNDAPTLTAPTAGETVGAATTLTGDAAGGGVEFVIDGSPVQFDGSAPFSFAVADLAEGSHTAAVQGCDESGASCDGPTSEATSFTVEVLHPAISLLTPTGFSPNGDGRFDTTRVTFALPQPQAVSYSVVSRSSGLVVRGPLRLGIPGAGAHAFVWNGYNNSGARVPDGRYTIEIDTYRHLTGGDLARGIATRDVRVDDTAPSLASLTGARATFYPYPDTYGDTWTAHITVGESATVSLEIYNVHNAVLRRISVYHSGAGTVALTWNGRSSSGAILPAGSWRFRIWAQDLAGNRHVTAYYVVRVSGLRLIARAATISRNGNTALIRTTDTSCTGFSYALSFFTYGVWLENNCSDPELILADYTFRLPAATRYTRIAIGSYGNTVSPPEHINGAWWNYSSSTWTLGSFVTLSHNNVDEWSALGSVTSAGRVSGQTAHVAVVVTNVDGVDEYDVGAVKVTVHYQVLG